MPIAPLTVVHVTHEATEKLGGIGTVLEGLITSPVYQRATARSIMVSPLFRREAGIDPLHRLGEGAIRVRYSGPDKLDPEGLGAVLHPIELAFGMPLVYGTRMLRTESHEPREAEAEVLLVDVTHPDLRRLEAFKRMLYERFDLDCMLYERSWDFEEYCRLAQPAWHALLALIPNQALPGVMLSHEYMGVCTALLAAADPQKRFRTFFHGHECSTARRIVEDHPGHDAMFYPAMREAMARGKRMPDVFPSLIGAANGRHALVSRVHHLDATLAVGDETAAEIRFLSHEFDKARVETCYNGVPSEPLTLADKRRSRAMIDAWLTRITGKAPDFLFTHVARPVISKGFWRDLRVCAHLEQRLRLRGKTAVYLVLACGAHPRSFDDVNRMAASHGWPAEHHEGYPDIAGPEDSIWRDIQVFNNPGRPGAGAVRAMFVNQFGFTRERLGDAAPPEMSLTHLRRAADVEFGQSIYEPFGIAHLEPLYAGAICVPSSVCGCVGFARQAMAALGWREAETPNILVADYTGQTEGDGEAATQALRDAREERVAARVAETLLKRLPETDEDREALLERGQRLAERMSWDAVCEGELLPVIRAVM